MELIDSALHNPEEGYRVLVCESKSQPHIAGYICFGPTPMTDRTYDLYWIVAHPDMRGLGVGGQLIAAMEAELLAAQARVVRIETSQLEGYDAARSFYARRGYDEVGRISDFYRQGDDLITLSKRLTGVP